MSAAWFPLHNHSHFSLLRGLSKPDQIIERLRECGYSGAGLTDYSSVSGCPEFLKELKKAKLKPILGCEFSFAEGRCCALAKNLRGWKALIKGSSASNNPNVEFDESGLAGDSLIVFSGYLGSTLANACFVDPALAYRLKSYEEVREAVRPTWKESVCGVIARYKKLFGENFYIAIQLVDQENLPAELVVARILRHCAKLTNTPKVATANSHYPSREDVIDQRVLLCSAFESTFGQVGRSLESDKNIELGAFFGSSNYGIPDPKEITELHKDCPDELENSLRIAESCEAYEVSNKPLLPRFECPGGASPDDYLRSLCEQGFAEKRSKFYKPEAVYRERLERELSVITKAELSSYFLIVHDYIQYATKSLRVKVGKGRGSASGCLVSYLTGITKGIDPIRFNLLFERFYSDARNSPGHIALPDIDTDFPKSAREKVIEYVRDKYGRDRVAQISTFNKIKGRGALKDVLRAWDDNLSFDERNKITSFIPDESKISDQLQAMEEEFGESSIIRWALEHNADELKDWCWIDESGQLQGPLAQRFEQAIRLEGTNRNRSRHASGVVICSEPLADVAPMVFDKPTGEMTIYVDMKQAELLGLLKFDILGLRNLDCVQTAENFIRTGRLC